MWLNMEVPVSQEWLNVIMGEATHGLGSSTQGKKHEREIQQRMLENQETSRSLFVVNNNSSAGITVLLSHAKIQWVVVSIYTE